MFLGMIRQKWSHQGNVQQTILHTLHFFRESQHTLAKDRTDAPLLSFSAPRTFHPPSPGHLLTSHRPKEAAEWFQCPHKHAAPVTRKQLMQHHHILPAFHCRISSHTEITLIFKKESAWNSINGRVLNTITTITAPKWAAGQPKVSRFRSQGSQSLTVIHKTLARRTLNRRFPKPQAHPQCSSP